MAWVCDYCRSTCDDGVTKCASCGAPVPDILMEGDFRTCPYCRRKLLALGSPACNYCGRRLPESYVKAHQAGMRRIAELEGPRPMSEADKKIAKLIGETIQSGELPDDPLKDLIGSLIRIMD